LRHILRSQLDYWYAAILAHVFAPRSSSLLRLQAAVVPTTTMQCQALLCRVAAHSQTVSTLT
jgi:hypothetical protein